MTPADALTRIIRPALTRLPDKMTSQPAIIMLLAIGLQESRFLHREQIGGPARSYWQFERGGLVGLFTHPATREHAVSVCRALGFDASAWATYDNLLESDALGCCMARLLLWSDPAPLPAADDPGRAWSLYLRTWRPGKPRPESWPECHRQAREAAAEVPA